MYEVFCVITSSGHTFSICTAAEILWTFLQPGDVNFVQAMLTLRSQNLMFMRLKRTRTAYTLEGPTGYCSFGK
jgi:hypothetical protein